MISQPNSFRKTAATMVDSMRIVSDMQSFRSNRPGSVTGTMVSMASVYGNDDGNNYFPAGIFLVCFVTIAAIVLLLYSYRTAILQLLYCPVR